MRESPKEPLKRKEITLRICNAWQLSATVANINDYFYVWGVKSFLETIFIAASLAFIGWGIINVGLRCKVSWMSSDIINGDTIKTKHEYGFQVGGPSDEERMISEFVQVYNGYQETYYSWADKFLIDLPDRDECLRFLYPQFNKIELLGASEDARVFFIICSEKQIIDFETVKRMGITRGGGVTEGYSVI